MSTKRCDWCLKDELYMSYHDHEWGQPVRDDDKMFEFLILETFQAGLSWYTVLAKRENFRKAFDNFDAEKIAAYTEKDITRLMNDAGIIRNGAKIRAAVSNAQAYLEIKKTGSFCDYLWQFTGGTVVQNKWTQLSQVPATSPESDAMSAALKKAGFKFVGSTVCYAHMQATGMINDHLLSCHKHPLNQTSK